MFARNNRASYQWIPVGRAGAPSTAARPRTPGGGRAPRSAGRPRRQEEGARQPLSFAEALTQTGLPASNLSPEQELIDLLENAAEIEHGLMVQYLYAMYSSRNQIVAGILKSIAIEEMGHFISVQNLLLSCGRPPYLGHSDWNKPTLFQPFPFKLEPVSRHSLAKYAIAEMPDPANVDADAKKDLPQIIGEADASAGTAVEAHRVGLLYAKIYWLLRADDSVLSDPSKEPWIDFPVAQVAAEPKLAGRHVADSFLVDASARNALPQHWKPGQATVIVDKIADRADALAAVAEVSAQGEGFGNTPQGHFDRFVEAWRLAGKPGEFAIRAPVDPWYAAPPAAAKPPAGDEITSPLGRLFARIGDLSYELTLLAAALYLLLPPSVPASTRGKAAKAAILAMRECLRTAANALAAIPLSQGGTETDPVCGLPFSVEPIQVASDPKVVRDRVRTLKTDLLAATDQIGAAADASDGQKNMAMSIANSINEDIWPRLEALPVGS